MSRGGHNWKGSGTVEGTHSLDVMELARAGMLCAQKIGTCRWSDRDGTTASMLIIGRREAITLMFRVKAYADEWKSVEQRVPICWTPCRFGGERPWFVCDVRSNRVYCGRRVAKLYGAGRLFACRQCYRLGYRIQRCGPMDRAHRHLARPHRKLRAEYDGPDASPPAKPKWMRWATYDRIANQIGAGKEHLDEVFVPGAQRLLARLERLELRRRRRR